MSIPLNEATSRARGYQAATLSQPAAVQAAPSLAARTLCAFVALACAAAGLALAAHHPLGGTVACVAFAAVALGMATWSRAWLVALPALVPLVGLAPWSGWITFEELDLLVLAIAAGGYTRKALQARNPAATTQQPLVGFCASSRVLVVLFAVSLGVSLARGIADAGGFRFGWFQGYVEPMNSLRLAKSFFAAWLLWPLWRDAQRARPAATDDRWMLGWCLALAGASLAALWERLAFTGLLDFSTDYRTTALFWEMHVGGAAFDGFLALTIPYALDALFVARTPARWLGAALVLLLASYACLTTFSRGVFLAIPVGALVMAVLALRQRQAGWTTPARQAALAKSMLMLAAYAGAAAWLFPSAGYRGMLALFGAVAVLLRLNVVVPRATSAFFGTGAGVVLSTIVALVSLHWAKGAYMAYAAVFALALFATATPRMRWLASAGYLALVAAFGMVCWRWGGDVALARAVPVTIALVLAGAVRGFGRNVQTVALRSQATLLACAIAVSAVVGVLAGGTYMTGRLSTAGEDFRGRVAHWSEGLGLLRSPAERAFGMGLGRYPAAYFSLHSTTDAPGEYALRDDVTGNVLALSGGQHMLGWGELLRVSQRIRLPRQPVTVEFQMRGTQALAVHVEICEKHLLYNGNCLIKEIARPASGQTWTPVRERLDGATLSRGAFYAPRMLVFSIGSIARGSVAEVRDLRLVDADGSDLLANADFSREMAGWLFSSDRNHMPWHLKNIFVNVLFDQGALGLTVFVALLLVALWRLGFGRARDHPLAPPIAASLVGFLVVGLFDSLLDVPRDAFVFYFLLLQALTLHGQRRT